MFSLQTNNARFVFTIHNKLDKCKNDYCKLINGFYFTKETRTDYMLVFTENYIKSIIRTLLFMYVFKWSPGTSIDSIKNNGLVNQSSGEFIDLNCFTAMSLIDGLLGHGFCRIALKPFENVLNEYYKHWRYFRFGEVVQTPSAFEVVTLYEFLNIGCSDLTESSIYISNNSSSRKKSKIIT